MRRTFRATAFLFLSVFMAIASATAPEVPTPTVTPMAAGKPDSADRDYPFFATDIVLANYGYVEQEFMFEGTANTYGEVSPDGSVEIAQRDIPYRTRLIVRRPSQQARFNGVGLVEWFNVTNQYDVDVLVPCQQECHV